MASHGLGLSIGRNNSSIIITDENEVSLFRRFKVPNFTAFEKKTFLALTVHGSEGLKDLENDLFHALSLLGKGFQDAEVQTNLKSMPFKVLEQLKGVKVLIQGKQLTPEEILTKIISKLHNQIDQHVVHIPKAVVTYPVSFGEDQQRSIEATCIDAGFGVLRLMDEHTAAACNHLIPESEKLQILFFDLSRRTFHVSLFSNLNPSNVDGIRKVTRGKENFGGDSFIKSTLDFCLDELKIKRKVDLKKVHKNEELKKVQQKDLLHLKKQCESAVIELTTEESCEVSLYGKHIIGISRSVFDSVNHHNFQTCMNIVEEVLQEAKVSKNKVQHIILDGKSCQMPRIQQMLREYFGQDVQFYYSPQTDSASSFAASFAVGGSASGIPSNSVASSCCSDHSNNNSKSASEKDIDDDKTDSQPASVENKFRTERTAFLMDTLKRINLKNNNNNGLSPPIPKPRQKSREIIQEEPEEPAVEEPNEIAEGATMEFTEIRSNTVDEFEGLLLQDDSRQQVLMEVMEAIYAESMDKAMANPKYIEPDVLQENHEISIQLALKTLSKLLPLTQDLMQSVKKILEKSYTEYKDINKEKKFAKGPAIGIDLGTTYCCSAYYSEDTVQIIPNDVGKNTTPSYVAFPQGGDIVVGEQAKNQALMQSQNAIFDVKRLIGRSPDDKRIQSLKKYWPFELFEENRKVKIQVGEKLFYPEEIITKLITFIKENAEAHFNEKVVNAVVTVPAYFNDRQRSLTKDACKKAGLNILQLLNEPTAAALAYRLHTSNGEARHCLIFDLGGGTFDLALLHIRDKKIHIKAIDGDPYLGGEDFDNAMVQHCITEFMDKHGVDISQEGERLTVARRQRRLKMECEKQKVHLSNMTCKKVVVSLDAICQNIDLNVTFTRELFESLIEGSILRCMQITDRTLNKAGLTKKDISEVVLVGGSSRIPRIYQVLSDNFPSSMIARTINAEEAVASGAAILAALVENPELPNISIQECENTVWI